MNIPALSEIRKAIFGEKGIFGSITEFIQDRWPPNMTPEQKSQWEMAFREFDARQEERRQSYGLMMEQLSNQAVEQFDQRVREMEGTANDLRTIPLLGSLMIFVRGAMRPVWCAVTLYFDWRAFNGGIPLFAVEPATGVVHLTTQGILLLLINGLVLGFIFGERTFRNIVPAIMPIIELVLKWRNRGAEASGSGK